MIHLPNRFALIVSLVLSLASGISYALEDTSNSIRLQVQDQQLVLDAQIPLPMTQTMEDALSHGIPLEYTLEVIIKDPNVAFWRNPINIKRTRVRLSYDSLKQIYLLTNLSLQRITTDRDLKRTLTSLGSLQALPIIDLNIVSSGHTYEIMIKAQLEGDALPNALRLSSLFDPNWPTQLPALSRYWTAP